MADNTKPKPPFKLNEEHPWVLFSMQLSLRHKLKAAEGSARKDYEEQLKSLEAEIRNYAEFGVARKRQQRISGSKGGQKKREGAVKTEKNVVDYWKRLQNAEVPPRERSGIIARELELSRTTVHNILAKNKLRTIKKRK